MSHIIEIELLIKDLGCLKAAVASIPGLEWREKKTYNWYGQKVNDGRPLPKGQTEADLGKCDFAIGVKGRADVYEVGVVKKKDGSGYTLVGDFWRGGFGLCELVGEKLAEGTVDDKRGYNFFKLANAYAAQVSAKSMKKKGYKTTIKAHPAGNYEVLCTK